MLDDQNLNEQNEEFENNERRAILWEAANLIAEGQDRDIAIINAENLAMEQNEAHQNEEFIDNNGFITFQDSKLNDAVHPNRRKVIAIYKDLCSQEDLYYEPLPFQI